RSARSRSEIMSAKSDLKCPESPQLQALLSGRLSGPDAERLEAHLQSCPSCQRDYQSLRQQSETRSASPPPGFGWRESPASQKNGTDAGAAGKYSFLLSPVEPDEIGRLGNYRVLRLLGKGGMAFVFLAEDIALRRSVALKVMKPDLDEDADAWQR